MLTIMINYQLWSVPLNVNLRWKHSIEKHFSLRSFLVQLCRPLSDQILKMVRVFLQHFKHRVHYVGPPGCKEEMLNMGILFKLLSFSCMRVQSTFWCLRTVVDMWMRGCDMATGCGHDNITRVQVYTLLM